MQIKKEELDRLNSDLHHHKIALEKERDRSKDLEARVVACDRILEKIVRATHGLPILGDSRRNVYDGAMTNYSGDMPNHSCKPPTELEMLRGQVIYLQNQIDVLGSNLCAARAIAEFAQEHKL